MTGKKRPTTSPKGTKRKVEVQKQKEGEMFKEYLTEGEKYANEIIDGQTHEQLSEEVRQLSVNLRDLPTINIPFNVDRSQLQTYIQIQMKTWLTQKIEPLLLSLIPELSEQPTNEDVINTITKKGSKKNG